MSDEREDFVNAYTYSHTQHRSQEEYLIVKSRSLPLPFLPFSSFSCLSVYGRRMVIYLLLFVFSYVILSVYFTSVFYKGRINVIYWHFTFQKSRKKCFSRHFSNLIDAIGIVMIQLIK